MGRGAVPPPLESCPCIVPPLAHAVEIAAISAPHAIARQRAVLVSITGRCRRATTLLFSSPVSGASSRIIRGAPRRCDAWRGTCRDDASSRILCRGAPAGAFTGAGGRALQSTSEENADESAVVRGAGVDRMHARGDGLRRRPGWAAV